MGICSPFWMRAIDTYGATTADKPAQFEPSGVKHIETETYQPVASTRADCTIAEGNCGTITNVTTTRAKEVR